MIKNLYTISSLLLSLSVFPSVAQVTLTKSFFPSVGDQQTMNLYDTTGVTQGSAGANQTWDFSQLSGGTSSGASRYLNPATTTDGFKFPAATIAQTDPTLDNSYVYYLLNETEYTILGTTLSQQGGTTTITYTNPQKAMNFPFTYNSVYNDDFAGSVVSTISPYPTVRTGKTSTTGDGTGQLTLPDGRKYTALRLKADQEIHDVTDFGDDFKSYIKSNTTSYSWYAAEVKGAIMTIHFITYESFMILEGDTMSADKISSKSVLVYDPIVAGVEKEFLKGDLLSVSPNPLNNEGTVSFVLDAQKNVEINLKSLQGTSVRNLYSGKGYIGENKIALSMAAEEPGMYLLEINCGNKRAYRKVVKK